MKDDSLIPPDSGRYKEFKHKVVDSALNAIKKNPKFADVPEPPFVIKAKDITIAVRRQIQPILAAGGWKDKHALRELICRLYLEAFHTLDKDEVTNLLTIFHMEVMMETIEADPWGTGKTDLLGGM